MYDQTPHAEVEEYWQDMTLPLQAIDNCPCRNRDQAFGRIPQAQKAFRGLAGSQTRTKVDSMGMARDHSKPLSDQEVFCRRSLESQEEVWPKG